MFLGHRDDVPDILSAASLFVLPSRSRACRLPFSRRCHSDSRRCNPDRRVLEAVGDDHPGWFCPGAGTPLPPPSSKPSPMSSDDGKRSQQPQPFRD